MHMAGVVDQQRAGSERMFGALHKHGDIDLRGHVAANADRCAARRFDGRDDLCSPLGAQVVDDD